MTAACSTASSTATRTGSPWSASARTSSRRGRASCSSRGGASADGTIREPGRVPRVHRRAARGLPGDVDEPRHVARAAPIWTPSRRPSRRPRRRPTTSSSAGTGTSSTSARPSYLESSEGKAAIDAGADIVFAHHPHLLDGVEAYHGGLIFYSLGNLVFSGFSGETAETVLVRAKVSEDGIDAQLMPVVGGGSGVPSLADGLAAATASCSASRASRPRSTPPSRSPTAKGTCTSSAELRAAAAAGPLAPSGLPMTLVICPNLAIDRMLAADRLRPGGTTRCRELSHAGRWQRGERRPGHQGPRRRGAAHRLRRRPRRPADRRARAGRGAGARGRRDRRRGARLDRRPRGRRVRHAPVRVRPGGGCGRRAVTGGPCPRPVRRPRRVGRRHRGGASRASPPASTPPSSAPPAVRATARWSTRPASSSPARSSSAPTSSR